MGNVKTRVKSSDVLLSNAHGAMGPLLPALFESPVMGVALLDGQFRFRAINGALAAMNGFPVSSHIGKKLRFVLGSSSATIEGLVRQALETGEPMHNLKVTAKLPPTPGGGRPADTHY